MHKKEHSTILTAEYTNPLDEDLEFEAGYEGIFASGDLDYKVEVFDFNVLSWRNDVQKKQTGIRTTRISMLCMQHFQKP